MLNVISSLDKAAAGEALTADPRVDMYHFTGSPAVGERIFERAAVGIRKVALELGGKSANIILADADLAVALPVSVGMCMANSGQGCALATRLVVHASRYDEVLDALAATIGALPAAIRLTRSPSSAGHQRRCSWRGWKGWCTGRRSRRADPGRRPPG